MSTIATVLLSQSPRPWNPQRVSVVSAAFATMCRTRYSHASLEVDGMTYTFVTSGLKVRPRQVFDERMFEVCEIGCAPVDMKIIDNAAMPDSAYDWGALWRGMPHLLAGRMPPYRPMPVDRYTCTSFVAHACGLRPNGVPRANRFTTTADIAAAVRRTGKPVQ